MMWCWDYLFPLQLSVNHKCICVLIPNRVASEPWLLRRLQIPVAWLLLEVLLTMALEESATTSGMIKLDSSNYSLWMPMMDDILYCKDLYEPIVKDKIPTGVTKEEWRVLHRKAVGMIRLYINHNIFHHVANDTNTYEMWQKLESMYERKTSMNNVSVIKRLAKLEYRDGTNMIEHLNVFLWRPDN